MVHAFPLQHLQSPSPSHFTKAIAHGRRGGLFLLTRRLQAGRLDQLASSSSAHVPTVGLNVTPTFSLPASNRLFYASPVSAPGKPARVPSTVSSTAAARSRCGDFSSATSCPAAPFTAFVSDRRQAVGSRASRLSAMADNVPREESLPSGFVLRPLESGDYKKGYLDLLGQLTTVGTISQDQFRRRVQEIDAKDGNITILVIEDTSRSLVVATGTLLTELKFIHECGKVGHIEDIVVHETERGKNLGKRIIDALVAAAKGGGCYKVILDCQPRVIPFYEKCGFKPKSTCMAQYFE